MNITITPALLKGPITVPASKSQAHRLIIAAALAQGESVLSNVTWSQDLEATLGCMEALGASFRREGGALTVTGMGANAMSPNRRMALPRLDCGESGSTLRFLIPVALAVRGGGVFTGHGRLMERPQGPYFELFREKGISCELKDGSLTVAGVLEPGEYRLPGDVSSQFFSGLLFALPLLRGDSRIVLTSPLESGDYVEMTRDVLTLAGVHTQGGRIGGNQTYSPLRQTVEADWSQAAFYFAAHTMGSDLRVNGLNPFSSQGDARVVTHCAMLASDEEQTLDMSATPDLLPPLAALAALRPGQTTNFIGAARLRLKESDRLAAVTQVLNALGGQVEEYQDGLVIYGVHQLAGGVTVDCHGDHRIAMMAAIAATRCLAPVTIADAECVAKSYPGFWADYESLGGQLAREQ